MVPNRLGIGRLASGWPRGPFRPRKVPSSLLSLRLFGHPADEWVGTVGTLPYDGVKE